MTFRSFAVIPLLAALFWCGAASAEHHEGSGPDWVAVADMDDVEVLTTDADGDARETVIWVAVHEGVPYIRTSGGSSWGDNIERDPDMALRIDGVDYPLRATAVADAALLEGIHAAFREKYGWFDGVAGVMRGSSPRIMRLSSRAPE